MENMLRLLWYSLLAIFKVIAISGAGAALAHYGILPPEARQHLSKISYYLLSPALLFSSLSGSINVEAMFRWWPLLLFPFLYSLLGFLLAHLLIRLFFIYSSATAGGAPSSPYFSLSALLRRIRLHLNRRKRRTREKRKRRSTDEEKRDALPLLSSSKTEAVEERARERDRERGGGGVEAVDDLLIVEEEEEEEEAEEEKEDYGEREAKFNDALKRCIIAGVTLANAGNLPLTLIISITHDLAPFNEDEEATSRGISYVSLYMTCMSLLVWTVGLNYIGRGPQLFNKEDKTKPSNSDLEGMLTKQESGSNGEKTDRKENGEEIVAHTTKREETQPSSMSTTATMSSSRMDASEAAKPFWKRLFYQAKGGLSPITFSLLSALFVGLIPPIRNLFHGTGAPLKFVMEIFDFLGLPSVPIVMLVLGASLAKGPRTSFVGIRPIAAVVIGKLLLMPLLGISITLAVRRMGLLPEDPLFAFVLMIQSATPSATVLVVISEIHQWGNDITPTLQFWQYVVAVFTLTFVTAFSLFVLL
ncbi:hypothetical protein QOT17_015718 [Balamuthia mandrillaris]